MCVQITKTANRFQIKFIIRKDIIETSQVVLNFCRTVYILIIVNPLWEGGRVKLSYCKSNTFKNQPNT